MPFEAYYDYIDERLQALSHSITYDTFVSLMNASIDKSYNIAKSLDYMILQPAQHQEVLRKYLYNKGFEIIQEDIVYDAEKYYHTMKVSIGSDIPYNKEVDY